MSEQEIPLSLSLDTRPTIEILRIINQEDRKVALAVAKVVPQIARAVDIAVEALSRGGRLVYLGAGSSGRLGVLDAAECIPTFGTDQVVGILAGAPKAMFRPAERAEDSPGLAARDLRKIKFNASDVLVGISAGGTTAYTLGGMRYARRLNAKTIAVTSNPRAPLRALASVAIVPVVGPEVITGSTRMKAGTAQKLVLNMLSTATMIRLGRVFSNWMIYLQMTNRKLRRRGEVILQALAGASPAVARRTLRRSGRNLPAALLMIRRNISKSEALRLLRDGRSAARMLRQALAGESRKPAQTRHAQ